MLKVECINPKIMEALSLCGHGSKILIADGNYPVEEKAGEAAKVYLGVRKGLPTVTDVLEVLCAVAPFERAEVMVPEEGEEPEIFAEFRRILPELSLEGMGRYEFYDAANKVVLAISTGEKRTFSNILLTVGCA